MTTIHDVAKLAGVSVATVSRALNDSGYVSASAREKVEEAAKELEYHPNEVARSLYQKKSKLIGLLLPDITNPFFPAIAKGVEDSVNERGYSLLLGNVEDDPIKEKEYLQIFSQNNIAGVISAAQGDHTDLKNIPVVLLDRVNNNQKYAVHSDDYLGGMLAAKAIIERNPKKVVVMVGPKNVAGSIIRLAGSEKVLKENKIPYELFQTASFHLDLAEETAIQFFEKHPDVDSVVASNDVYALAVMREAIKRGRKIPEEFQIIGYDNMAFSGMMYPGLSTIAQPAYEIGYQGAELLCDILDKGKISEKHIQLPVTLKLRESLRKKD